MLQTLDLDATVDFYTHIVGFEVENYQADWGWVSLKFGGINIMFSILNQHSGLTKPVMSGSLYLNPIR